MRKYLGLIPLLSFIVLLSSCGVNSYVMFKSSDDDVIMDSIPLSPTESYRLAPDDKFTMLLYVEKGKRIIDFNAGIYLDEQRSNSSMEQSGGVEYTIRKDGTVELPVVGLIKLAGFSIIESQEMLKEMFSHEYVDPYIVLEVTNRRVIVFPGSGGDAKVVPIQNDNTTLMEALALAGGIAERGKARNVKIMRQTSLGREVYQVDLSTLDGLQYADMIVQANDYIYVEPTKQLTREFLKEVTPFVTLVSSAMIIITVILSLK